MNKYLRVWALETYENSRFRLDIKNSLAKIFFFFKINLFKRVRASCTFDTPGFLSRRLRRRRR